MTHRTKMLAISPKVKAIVWERDGHCCIKCGNPCAAPEAHYIARSQGGLGIEENIVTLCRRHHDDFDFGVHQFELAIFTREYLQSKYPYWNDDDLIYRKGM